MKIISKILPATLLLFFTACATPEFASPTVSKTEIDAAAKTTAPLVKMERSRQEAYELVGRVKNRMRPAVATLCAEMSGGTCAFDVTLKSDELANAFASGKGKVTITTGLLEYLKTDDEVAMVLGHEFGHHMANHLQETQKNARTGSIIGALVFGAIASAGQNPYQSSYYNQQQMNQAVNTGASLGATLGAVSYSKDQEREADYIAAYVMALAGYDTSQAASVMDKLAAIKSNGKKRMSFFSTHPSNPEREARLIKIAAEIEEKKSMGDELIPTRKNPATKPQRSKQLKTPSISTKTQDVIYEGTSLGQSGGSGG